jgi:sulfhydrogenase subunit beta (sulfur reductase)
VTSPVVQFDESTASRGEGAAVPRVIDVDGLDQLITVLVGDGWTVLAPTLADGVIRPGPVSGVADLPRGIGDDQQPGRYRLRGRDDDALFGFASPAVSPKSGLLPTRTLLWRGRRDGDGIHDETPVDEVIPTALLGVRSCDLAATQRLDRVLGGGWQGRPADPHYTTRREQTLIIAVACGQPAATCFCTSMGTGPAPREGYDLALTEVLDGAHRFVVDVGSERGGDLIDRVRSRQAEAGDLRAAGEVTDACARAMTRTLATNGIAELLDAEVEHPMWDEVAERCLACGNCTAVCPTCFCTAVEDVNDLLNENAERWRVWDSCFTPGFSHVHGGPVRSSTASRYRQWMSHKLGTWQAQFDESGCVGCGRCITWCPVGIDITAQARVLASSRRAGRAEEGVR